MSKIVKVELKEKPGKYEIRIENESLNACGDWAKTILPDAARRIAVVSNKKVFSLYGKTAVESLENKGFEVLPFLMPDGEKYKSFSVLEKTLEFFGANNLKRADAIVALGGGVVGDLAGFAASVYLRGIAFLQIPTTLLAMIDSSVGGKTAVNSRFGKNTIGAFYQPGGVLIDVETLRTLPRRELTAGFCEAVKQGAIASRKLFDETAGFLENYPVDVFKKQFSKENFLDDLQNLLASQIQFKAEIVAGDERENAARADSRSRKILNFGHTVAHALEKITRYSRFRHGEAVGYGILAAGEISKIVANFNQNELKSLNDVVKLTGQLPATDKIDIRQLTEAFAFDKKQIGDSLQWVLLETIGQPKIFLNKEIPEAVIRGSLEKILRK